jgi:hypothetical protein
VTDVDTDIGTVMLGLMVIMALAMVAWMVFGK